MQQLSTDLWQPIATIPHNGGKLIVLSNTQLAVAWYEPECGHEWKIAHVPGLGVSLGDVTVNFHSWCTAYMLQRTLNICVNPVYYGIYR
jgi:hypothetical protein